MSYIFKNYPISEIEYKELDRLYGKLVEFISWQLIRKNNRNYHTDSQEDIAQDIKISLLQAGSYYKRQTYIESCFKACEEIKSKRIKNKIAKLWDLWINRTRHGAHKQKFGPIQEEELFKIVNDNLPEDKRPNKKDSLKIDSKFSTYCKAITWNASKALGKKITKDKVIRNKMTSLSEYDYLIGVSI